MDRDALLAEDDAEVRALFGRIQQLHLALRGGFRQQFDRSLPWSEELFDRWERASELEFGEGSSIYDLSFVFGPVKVGKHTWVGPFTMLDGTGGLEIGDYCMISTGVQIYTHDTVKWSLSAGKAPAERSPVTIEDCCYIGSQAVINRGVTIGHHSVVGAGAFVNRSLPPHSVAVGVPARVIGETQVDGDEVQIRYFKQDT